VPTNSYCKTAQNDPSTVRGARNYPCQEFPGKRAPTVALCRDPNGYVPTGTNPWRGPPIPYGTPVTNGLNVLPPNKFPFVPPGADPDPGIPIVGPPPPGVIPGPGPAPIQPAYDPPPPNDSGPPPGNPSWLPPNYPPVPPQIPYPKFIEPPGPPVGTGPQPQASGPAYSVYDQTTGAFKDPAGGTGIFAPGISGRSSAENWVDLMLAPKPL
jgi:phospholipid/cholesterol/gamma-HCH transport system substrate-binding protein